MNEINVLGRPQLLQHPMTVFKCVRTKKDGELISMFTPSGRTTELAWWEEQALWKQNAGYSTPEVVYSRVETTYAPRDPGLMVFLLLDQARSVCARYANDSLDQPKQLFVATVPAGARIYTGYWQVDPKCPTVALATVSRLQLDEEIT